MRIDQRIPDLSDKELESLQANAVRLVDSGSPIQRQQAEELLPLAHGLGWVLQVLEDVRRLREDSARGVLSYALARIAGLPERPAVAPSPMTVMLALMRGQTVQALCQALRARSRAVR